LPFFSLLLNLFFSFVLFIVHRGQCWCRFGRMTRARPTREWDELDPVIFLKAPEIF
jgi:hypothetical protein